MANIQSYFHAASTPPPPSSPVPSSPPYNQNHPPSASAISYPTNWKPPHSITYIPTPISQLRLGISPLVLTGRIANLSSYPTTSQKPQAAKFSLRLTISDGTGAVEVKLWHSTPLPGQDVPEEEGKKKKRNLIPKPEKEKPGWCLKLGMRVVVYTTSVAALEAEKQAAGTVPFQVILTEWDEACRIVVYRSAHESVELKRALRLPIGAEPRKKELLGLTRLAEVTAGAEIRVLVCVRSVGALKRVTLKGGSVKEKVEVGVFDESVSGGGKVLFLTLWGVLAFSASGWVPNETVLLLTNPTITDWKGTKQLAVGKKTLVDVDPDLRDSIWLREFAKKQLKSQAVGTLFPGDEVFEWERELAGQKVLYTLADIDEFAREHPSGQCIGFLSLIIVKMNLVSLYKKNMLFNGTHCTLAHYSNQPTHPCKQCDTSIPLILNTHIFETLSDETGSIRSGKLLVSDKAWTSFFAVEPAKLCEKYTMEQLMHMEAVASMARAYREHMDVVWAGKSVDVYPGPKGSEETVKRVTLDKLKSMNSGWIMVKATDGTLWGGDNQVQVMVPVAAIVKAGKNDEKFLTTTASKFYYDLESKKGDLKSKKGDLENKKGDLGSKKGDLESKKEELESKNWKKYSKVMEIILEDNQTGWEGLDKISVRNAIEKNPNDKQFSSSIPYGEVRLHLRPRAAKSPGCSPMGSDTCTKDMHENGQCGHFMHTIIDYEDRSFDKFLKLISDHVPTRIERGIFDWEDTS
ncbi:hypothetical protein BJ508DRAFT_325941 [Ascobolus immersus RN42]|uniref:Uncharacterized protein n=1 Tax=Ascobolus immersus RN42 TaxID=1160509 RepID=A0A3N4I763_ASCIM|nr:hypothetical protein BJ508DRAFT_325941 [Ascobolus immersus RN42]